MEEKTDLRVVKTKKALVEAMIKSLGQKPFEEITVQYICDLALVRRATFYTHFADKYELFGYAVRCTYRAFPSFQQLHAMSQFEDIYRCMIEDAIGFLTEHTAIFQLMVDSQWTRLILDIICHEVEGELLPILVEHRQLHRVDDLTPELTFHFYIHGIFGAFLWWLREGYPITKEELVAQLQAKWKP